jgi:menaquinone-dependent protoporphyrinogen oxidase
LPGDAGDAEQRGRRIYLTGATVSGIVIVYATTDGHTERVARHVAQVLGGEGVRTQLIAAAAAPPEFSFAGADAVVIAGSVRMGKHQQVLTRLVRARAAELSRIPGAFLSVSLSAARDNEPARREVRKTVARFLEETGWTPGSVLPVAGALLYRRYGFFLRLVMRFISKRVGGDTDTSRDYEYTDWNQLTEFARRFARGLEARRSPEHATVA